MVLIANRFYNFVDAEKVNHAVKLPCKVMAVFQSGYYAWRKRLTTPPKIKRRKLSELVKNCYFENRRRYGSRRIRAELQRSGEKVGRFRVRQVMREQGLRAIKPRRFVLKITDSSDTKAASPNLLKDLESSQAADGDNRRHNIFAIAERQMVLLGDVAG